MTKEDRTTGQQISQGATVAGITALLVMPLAAGAILGGVWLSKKACGVMGITCNWMDLLGWGIGIIFISLIILGMAGRLAEAQRGSNTSDEIQDFLNKSRGHQEE